MSRPGRSTRPCWPAACPACRLLASFCCKVRLSRLTALTWRSNRVLQFCHQYCDDAQYSEKAPYQNILLDLLDTFIQQGEGDGYHFLWILCVHDIISRLELRNSTDDSPLCIHNTIRSGARQLFSLCYPRKSCQLQCHWLRQQLRTKSIAPRTECRAQICSLNLQRVTVHSGTPSWPWGPVTSAQWESVWGHCRTQLKWNIPTSFIWMSQPLEKIQIRTTTITKKVLYPQCLCKHLLQPVVHLNVQC